MFCMEVITLLPPGISSFSASGSTHPNGMGFYLGLSALNFAEADKPTRLLTKQQLSEMYFTLVLQCHFSIPYGAVVPMVGSVVDVKQLCGAVLYRVLYLSPQCSGTTSSVLATWGPGNLPRL